ncbi:hypothetical protein [Flavobacterium sp.]|mgnify:CR=1 FL=1|uniref:hypothetical protein n=1 Tax=Flavobacterium sp. TaxID=239 RepID=UPI004047BA2C
MREIDTQIFREIIENEGCFCIYEDIDANYVNVSHYMSRTGNKRVLLLTSEEFISERTAKNYLIDLDLTNLIDLIPFN